MGRKSVSGTGRKSRTFRRIAVDYKHKLEVLRFLGEGAKSGKAVQKFYPNIQDSKDIKKKHRLFSAWKKSRELIEYMCSQGSGHHKNSRKLGDAIILPGGAEEYLVMWINLLWRESIRCKTRQGQTNPEDAQIKAAQFCEKVRELIVKHNISPVLNADQTAVFYEYLPTKTINETGESTVWVKCGGKDKERATVMLEPAEELRCLGALGKPVHSEHDILTESDEN